MVDGRREGPDGEARIRIPAPAAAAASASASDRPQPEAQPQAPVSGPGPGPAGSESPSLLSAVPCQRRGADTRRPPAAPRPRPAAGDVRPGGGAGRRGLFADRPLACPARSARTPARTPARPARTPAPASDRASARISTRWARSSAGFRRQAFPTPRGTPFTFGYLLVLLGTSLYAAYGDQATVSALLRGSSTDVAHLAERPALVLVASALWIAGGLTSPYALAFALVLTALERRVGAWRAAGVFLFGHVTATLGTELPIGLSVATGHLPDSSLHRLDYGISFGLLASVGALAAFLAPLPRVLVPAVIGVMLLHDLVALADPLTDWGHPLALLAGLACGPFLRRGVRARSARLDPAPGRGCS
ncbi:rhomboid-like protein [Streptomyces sp. AM 4-1-1]|uniref:rhomboid-like protein n=1 Tax=Streptomyces sp. AM 4-1-1 TaxID=3028710 RepID=UPI0031BBBD56